MQFLLRYFPEIHHLPKDQQVHLVRLAQERLASPDNKLRLWRGNLLRFSTIAVISLLWVMFLGPALGLGRQATGWIMMLVLVPILFYLQHRHYIAQLRPYVREVAPDGVRERAPGGNEEDQNQ